MLEKEKELHTVTLTHRPLTIGHRPCLTARSLGNRKSTWMLPELWMFFFFVVLCLVTQRSPTLCDPVDYSPPGSSVRGDSPHKNTGVGCHAFLCIQANWIKEAYIFFTFLFNPLITVMLTWVFFLVYNIFHLSSHFLIANIYFFSNVSLLFPPALLRYNWHITLCEFRLFKFKPV